MAVNLQNEGIYGSTVGTWLEEPEEGYALQLSTFGQVHSTLESFVTDRSIAFCAGQTATQAPLQDARHLQVIFWKKKNAFVLDRASRKLRCRMPGICR